MRCDERRMELPVVNIELYILGSMVSQSYKRTLHVGPTTGIARRLHTLKWLEHSCMQMEKMQMTG